MEMITDPTQLACFSTPRERVTAWAQSGLRGSVVSAARMKVTAADGGANGTDATGYMVFEDPL